MVFKSKYNQKKKENSVFALPFSHSEALQCSCSLASSLTECFVCRQYEGAEERARVPREKDGVKADGRRA